MNQGLLYFASFSTSFLLSVILVPVVRNFAGKHHYVAQPRADRWHKKETVLFGGVGIFISLISAWQVSALTFGAYTRFIPPLLPVVIGGTAIFLLGLIDDLFDINPQYKLIGQVVVASIVVIFGFQVNWFESKTANLLISIFWIVGITNAFNLLDNMDGLSAGIACISGFFLFIWLAMIPGFHVLAVPVQFLLCAYVGSILGFLIYNFNPASIFMGDAGSLFIGFMMACLTVMESPAYVQGGSLFNQLFVVAVPCFILFIPILDTTFVSLMRKLFARSVFQGGRDHSSHRMVAIGFSERKSVAILYFFAGISGLIALSIYPLRMDISIVIIVLYLIIVLLFWIYLANVEVYTEKSSKPPVRQQYFIPVLNTGYGRTLFSILFDLILITVAYYSSYLLRFEGTPGPNFTFFLKSLPILFACQIVCFYIFGVYQRLWWGSRLGDLAVYIKAVTSGTVLAMLILLFLYRFQSFSRAVFVIYGGVMLIFVSFSRLFFCLLDEWVSQGNNHNGKRTLIYGAGAGGEMLVQEIKSNGCLGLSIVGFIDDNPQKIGKRIFGHPVLGNMNHILEIARKYHVKEIIISFRDHQTEKKKEINRLFQKTGIEVTVRQMQLMII